MFRWAVILCVSLAVSIHGHGRFMKPPNRSSIWRVPEFAAQNPPINYGDNELFCGGAHQVESPGDNCGVCGDPFAQSAPRANEIGGQYYSGIITGDYKAGQVIDVEVELTTAHLGNMEWRLCDNPAGGETQACFNRHLLERADGGGTQLPVDHGTGWYRTQLRIPAGVTCDHCVIQWNYRAGNTWGCGSPCGSDCGSGCGPQETFRGCSDVRITN